MPSDYPSFEVKIDNDDGSFTSLPLATIKVYDVTHVGALADTASDAEGVVPGDTLAVDAGTLIRFSFSQADGVCGYTEIFTA